MRLAAMILIFMAVVMAMEVFAWAMHRYVMHGPMWVWHRSHHEAHDRMFELNDLFALVFALPAVVLIFVGMHVWPWAMPIGLGVTAYGVVYGYFHDGLVHRRYPTGLTGRSDFWRKRIQAHRLHHAVHTREGCVSYGFLWVQPVRALKAQLVHKRISSSKGA
ncbi:sterol desaturase family protein [Brevundimonas sp.]|uniref:sterol desaturase family protein n=1 Tax=Brevundimonas sp. TaxID=1871086 RepID=UPI003BACBDBC